MVNERANPSYPKAWVRSVTFSDSNTLHFERSDITVIVGPNNAGKSEVLRNIRDKFVNQAATGLVVKEIEIERDGSTEDVISWLNKTTRRTEENPTNPQYTRFGTTVSQYHINRWDVPGNRDLSELGKLFCYHLSADERLRTTEPPQNIALTTGVYTHPVHWLQADDELEQTISKLFRKAFRADLIVHRNAGNTVPLYTGQRPELLPNEDRVSRSYLERLERLPRLVAQGDGVRAYVGILLQTLAVEHSVILLDEPEAFLHPPQIRHLARALAQELPDNTQLFIATHSGDFLRALVAAETTRVKILRLDRKDDVNRVSSLNSSAIRDLWADSLIRYSNVLDGLFHEKTIVTEADSDCKFYAAIGDAGASAPPVVAKSDVMFSHCGGKARLAVVVRALHQLSVPVAAVGDLDILSDEHPLREIYEALGGAWIDIEKDWSIVKKAVDQKRPELSTVEIKRELERIIASVPETMPSFPEGAIQEIRKLLKRSSPWAIVKETGVAYIPPGDATKAYSRLRTTLHRAGLFLVEVGELEGFDRSVGGHGPRWVNEVLAKNLTGCEFEAARQFVHLFSEA